MEQATSKVACAHCHALNRIPTQRLTEDPVCGKCGKDLLDGQAIELNDANFDAIATRTELPLLVDFWAPWCGPCRSMAPHFEQAARELKGRVVFAKINSDDNPLTARRFGIRSLPTLVRLAGGREEARQSGALKTSQITALAV